MFVYRLLAFKKHKFRRLKKLLKMPVEWSLIRWNTPYLPVVICPNAAFCYQRSKHKNIRPRRYDMFLAHTQHWIHLLCDAMLSSAIILRKTVVSHWLKSPVSKQCNNFTKNCCFTLIEEPRLQQLKINCRPFKLQDEELWPRRLHFPYKKFFDYFQKIFFKKHFSNCILRC